MSGCVNCVWETYRDEVEDWAKRLEKAQKSSSTREEIGMIDGGLEGHSNIDDSNESNPERPPAHVQTNGEALLFKHLPVGISEFMRTEKRLKARRTPAT